MIFGKFMAAVNYTKVVMEKPHLQVSLPLWFLGPDLVYFDHWLSCQIYKQCFTASSQQTVYISQSFPGG